MQYFGVPTCPYCKKRVNLIRTWSLKRQGEFRCPRCGGISNIYLSPLLYVVALLAVFTGGAIYFFHKFVLDDISLETALQVFLPFAVFFFLSIFFVYLAKPVIKKVSKEELKRGKRRGKKAAEAAPSYYDNDDYPPQREVRAPMQAPAPEPPVRRAPPRQAPAHPSVQDQPLSARLEVSPAPAPHPAAFQNQPRPAAPYGAASIRPPVPVNRRPAHQAPAVQRPAPPAAAAPQAQAARTPAPMAKPLAPRPATPPPPPPASHVDIPHVADDFFAKYDDPDYVQRRLREMRGQDK